MSSFIARIGPVLSSAGAPDSRVPGLQRWRGDQRLPWGVYIRRRLLGHDVDAQAPADSWSWISDSFPAETKNKAASPSPGPAPPAGRPGSTLRTHVERVGIVPQRAGGLPGATFDGNDARDRIVGVVTFITRLLLPVLVLSGGVSRVQVVARRIARSLLCPARYRP